MGDLFRRPDCVIHEVNVTVDPDRCVKCGAVKTWAVPVGIDRLAVRDTIIECDGMGYDIVTDRIMELFDAVGEEEQ